MFQLNKIEAFELVANCDRLNSLKHSSILPWVFTEQGVAMLSSVDISISLSNLTFFGCHPKKVTKKGHRLIKFSKPLREC
jgi:hypothetical protein